MTKRRKARRGLVALVVGMMVLSACGGAEDDQANAGSTNVDSGTGEEVEPASETLKIGAAISQSGDLFEPGTSLLEGYEFWVKNVNAAGGISVDGTSYEVELIVYDDESDSTTAATLTDRLISQDGVDFMFGPFSSDMTLAVGAITERNGTVLIQAAGNADNVYDQGWERMFGLLPMASTIPTFWLESMTELDEAPSTLGILAKDDSFPLSQRDGLIELAEELGVEVTVDEVFSPDTQDFSALISNLRSTDPELVALLGHTQDNIRFVRQSREQDYAAPAVFYSGGSMQDFQEGADSEADYGMGATFYSPQMQTDGETYGSASDFASTFENETGNTPDWLAAVGVSAGLVLQQAIEDAGSLDPEEVASTLESGVFETFQGTADFEPNGLNVGASAMIEQIIEGEIRLVAPAELAEREPVYPAPAWSERD